MNSAPTIHQHPLYATSLLYQNRLDEPTIGFHRPPISLIAFSLRQNEASRFRHSPARRRCLLRRRGRQLPGIHALPSGLGASRRPLPLQQRRPGHLRPRRESLRPRPPCSVPGLPHRGHLSLLITSSRPRYLIAFVSSSAWFFRLPQPNSVLTPLMMC